MQIDEKHLTEIALAAAKAAGQEILKIYESTDLGLKYKADESPLTKADLAAHQKISEFLVNTQLPVLSEEGKNIPFKERKDWDIFWMVDPLDGTKEFVKKNGEFTVNIALIKNGVPVMGVVYAPVLDWMYWGNSQGAWKTDEIGATIKLLHKGDKLVETIVASRSHLSIETQEVIDQYPGAEVISMGSSLKFMLLADNKAQLYPRFAPTMEWDTAAAHAILRALGYEIKKVTANEPLAYNKENLLNPWFIAS
ncbi:3'(2'),5'-bisphosphate nucleotidase CysQ [uncultured Cyclobacterium sp.]|uniref:3'(2'),5'-bisphosphate nucleotidase CysQ n=1 Tax=uncultured Cyclobacterium sp. TaxID=453820 RepID=UPI0030EF6EE1|tara:strand:+ start:89378 stop:90133 length:756 start_codon:yes stop_codon:yes gene_type:complete